MRAAAKKGTRAAAVLLWLAAPAAALDLSLPGGSAPVAEDRAESDTLTLPVGPWQEGGAPAVTAQGAVTRRVWRLDATQATTLQLTEIVRGEAEAQGYEILYDCADDACGGFDFRYGLPLLPEPEMHVDLGDFRHLTARGPDGALAGVTVSRGGSSAFVHLAETTAGPPPPSAPPPSAPSMTGSAGPRPPSGPDAAPPADTLGARLEADGHVVLDDLRFASGSSDLDPGDYASLAALARYLAGRPEARITLVGHSDASGGLSANKALSKRRAEAVLRRLVEQYGVSRARLSADGVAYLAPLASNATEEGRRRNRRVEAVRDDTG